MKPIDCFLFFNELDLLEIRLNALAPYVSEFVICESTITHSGNKKPLYFQDNMHRFSGFPITHIIADMEPRIDPWEVEGAQRNVMFNVLSDYDPDQIILVSDIDEIPDLTKYDGAEGGFLQEMYYYYLNCFTGIVNWKGTIAIKKKNITTINSARYLFRNGNTPALPNCKGWHFSTLGTDEEVIYKIESFAHQECNNAKTKMQLLKRKAKLQDGYSELAKQFIIEMPSGPQWLLDNINRYKHLLK